MRVEKKIELLFFPPLSLKQNFEIGEPRNVCEHLSTYLISNFKDKRQTLPKFKPMCEHGGRILNKIRLALEKGIKRKHHQCHVKGLGSWKDFEIERGGGGQGLAWKQLHRRQRLVDECRVSVVAPLAAFVRLTTSARYHHDGARLYLEHNILRKGCLLVPFLRQNDFTL